MDEKLVREQLMKMAQAVSSNFCWKVTFYFIRKETRPDDRAMDTYLSAIGYQGVVARPVPLPRPRHEIPRQLVAKVA